MKGYTLLLKRRKNIKWCMLFNTLLLSLIFGNCNLVSDDCDSVQHPRDELTILVVLDSIGNNLIRQSSNIAGIQFEDISESESIELDNTFSDKLALFIGRNDNAEIGTNHLKIFELGLFDSNAELNIDTIEVEYDYIETPNCPFVQYGNLQIRYNNIEIFNREYMQQIEIVRP